MPGSETQFKTDSPKQRGRHPTSEAATQAAGLDAVAAGLEQWTGSDFSQATFQRHAALLGDGRLSRPANTGQRVRIVQQLQRDYGNQYVQRLIKQVKASRETSRQNTPRPQLGPHSQEDESQLSIRNSRLSETGGLENLDARDLAGVVEQTSQADTASRLSRASEKIEQNILAPVNQPGTVVQRQEDEGEYPGFWEAWAKAIEEIPSYMADHIDSILKEMDPLFEDLSEGNLYFNQITEAYSELWFLKLELRQMEGDSKTTEDQRTRAHKYYQQWLSAQEGLEAANLRRTKDILRQAAEADELLKIQLTYAYSDIYHAGKEPGDVKVGSSNMKDLAAKGVDLLKAINEADALVTGRNVAPVIPVLDKALAIVNLITGWKVTSDLASESQEGMKALQNAISAATTVLGLAGFGKFLPLFAYIGPLLDGIAKGWDRIVGKLREKNRMWWQARDVMGEDLPHGEEEPGGREVFNYMKKVFEESSPLKGKPSGGVVEFFDKNRQMFSDTAKQVMGKSWGGIPTESSWLFWEEVDADKLNGWVFYNREMTWRLIYGRGMELPN